MKVFVTTKSKACQDEIYVRVNKNLKSAEKAIKAEFPHMVKMETNNPLIHRYASDDNRMWILNIHEEEI